ncbi:MAG: hypothetical protein J3Q66DRAFT_442107 [Benniella sp.]|nr:MAG: hypothetical protein J3Q66DRAFT_442107 [Benniella sp.]
MALIDNDPISIVLPHGSATLSHHTANPNLERDSSKVKVLAIVYLSIHSRNTTLSSANRDKPQHQLENKRPPFLPSRHGGAMVMAVQWSCRSFSNTSPRSNTLSALNLTALATDPDSTVFQTQVKIALHVPTPNKEPELPEQIRQIVKIEFPEAFPTVLPNGLSPDRGDSGLYCKLSKCSFMQEETEFLGHAISKNELKTDAGLVEAVRERPIPTT